VSRVATALLAGDARRVITTSRSAIVEMVIGALRLPSVCAESRPGLEGRALAERLAQDSLAVTVLTDAAIGSAFEPGDVVLVGADAIAGDWFANKTGTGQLCAAATLAGVPAYVVSGREKCVAPVLAEMLRLREDDPRLVWDNPPAGVSVENVLFERIPLERVAAVITDSGLLAGGMIAAACESAVPQPAARALVELMQVLPDQGKAG
jgi:translation initiation factor eIF-2B subunit delta